MSNFTEGSYAVWNLEQGQYRLKWRLKTTDKTNFDSVYLYDGETLELLTTTTNATIQYSATQWTSPETTTDINIQGNKLAIIVLDEQSKTSTTNFEIVSLEKKLKPVNPFSLILLKGLIVVRLIFHWGLILLFFILLLSAIDLKN